jgi:DNA-binding protein HU-beta
MNKSDFVGVVATNMGGTKDDAAKAVDAVLNSIGSVIASGEPINFKGFGIFSKKVRAARTARNPMTGASVEVPEKKTVKFKPGKDLEGRL